MPQEKVGLGERSVHGQVRKILWASEVSYATPHPSTSYHHRHVVSCKVLEQWSSPKHTIKFICLLFSEISLLTTVIQDIHIQLARVSLFSLIFEIHLIHSYEAMEYNLEWNFLQVRFKISSWLWRIWKLGFMLIALQSFNQQKGKLGNRLSFLNPKLMGEHQRYFLSLQHNLWTENHNQAIFVFTVIIINTIINTKKNNSSRFSAYSHLYWVTHELKRDPDRPHQCLCFSEPTFTGLISSFPGPRSPQWHFLAPRILCPSLCLAPLRNT